MGSARFLGSFRHSLDAKGRFAVPVVFRKKLAPSEETFFFVPGRYGAVEVHPVAGWDEYQRRSLENQPEYAPETQRSIRYLYSQAAEASLDTQGRLLLPKHLKDDSGIGSDLVVAGVGGHFEVWEPVRYERFIAEARKRYDEDRNSAGRQSWEVTRGHAGSEAGDVPRTGDGR